MNCWLHATQPRNGARVRLLCLPAGGGTAQDFAGWSERLSASVHVCAVQLPGRQERFNEPAQNRVEPLAQEISTVVRSLKDLPFVLFGDCMGALLAFEVARELRCAHGMLPSSLIVASCPPPHHPRALPPYRDAPKHLFRQYLLSVGGLPQAAIDDEELFELLLPTLRADFSIIETYQYVAEPPLACDIHAIGGEDDPHLSDSVLEGWKHHTSRAFSRRMFAGDHFVVRHNAAVLGHVQRLVQSLCQGAGEGPHA